MQAVNMLQAKTSLSRLVEAIEQGEEREIVIARNGRPAAKLIWLDLRNITAHWCRPTHSWKRAMNEFAILYADRFIKPIA